MRLLYNLYVQTLQNYLKHVSTKYYEMHICGVFYELV